MTDNKTTQSFNHSVDLNSRVMDACIREDGSFDQEKYESAVYDAENRTVTSHMDHDGI